VRDWSSVVRSRLIALGIEAEREEQIRAELAGHLEDAYADAIRRGCTEEDAAARALAQVPDWTRLADAIRRADQKEGPMSPDAKTLWLPGMAALGCAAAVMLGVPRLLPASLWLDPRATMPMTAGLLLSYLAFGALGASLSRRAGGGIAARLAAGIFPLALHVSMFVTVVVAAMFGDRRSPEAIQINFQLRAALIFIVIPGIALAVGTLPFLRDGAKTRASA
jgi:hypothetical protein